MLRKKLILFFISFSYLLNAQVGPELFDKITGKLKDSSLVFFDQGKSKFLQENYIEAVPYFLKAMKGFEEMPELNYITGICYSYDINETPKALTYIRKASGEANNIDGYFFNLAYALEKNDSLTSAIGQYELALAEEERKGMSKSTYLIREIHHRIARCKKAIEFKNKQNLVRISNIGKPVNTEANEYGPLITSNETIMIFTYRGAKSKGGNQVLAKAKKKGSDEKLTMYFEDVFMSKKINDTTWSEPVQLDNLNTMLHDAAVSLSADGTQLFIYRNNGQGKGDLFLSTLVGNTFSKPVYQAGLNSHEWEGSACFIPYQDKIIFASERKGGLGGKDLYIAEKLKPNKWGNIKNMGPVINTKNDEDAPFVTADGKILFYSSNNSNSIGGYDIFRSDFKNDTWQEPYNLGPPINTKNDDKFFIVRADGQVGYYSSTKQGGKGEQDIYKIEPGIPGMPVEMLEVNGLVTVDGKPVEGWIEISSLLKINKFNTRIKAGKNGSFLTHLPAGDKYEIVAKVDKFPQQVVELNTLGIDSFVVLNVFAEFNSAEYDQKLEELVKSNKENDLNKNSVFNKEDFAARYGNTAKEGLFYKVQIGAYKIMENFNYNNILGFPRIIRYTGNDYITRFVMGNYSTYNEAQELLDKIKKADVLKDSFIIAFYKDERKYLQQLVNEKIIE